MRVLLLFHWGMMTGIIGTKATDESQLPSTAAGLGA